MATQQAYFSGIKAIPPTSNAGKPTYERETDTVPATGITDKVVVCVAPDYGSIFVDLHFRVTRLLALLPEHWAGAPPDADVTIQHPVTSVINIDKACAIPDGSTLLLGALIEETPTGPSTRSTDVDQKIAGYVEQDQHRHAYLLIKPTILRPGNRPTTLPAYR